jgi:hypothetical protein
MFASNNTNTNNRGSFGSRKKTNLPNKALDQLAEGGMAASNEDRIARFSTHKSENRYLEVLNWEMNIILTAMWYLYR